MKFLVVVTPLSIYHGSSTRKTFWEGNFIGKEDLFLSVNMKDCGRQKVRKYKDIKGSDKNFTLDISSKFDILNKMKTTYSESKGKLEISGKELVTALDLKTKVRFRKSTKRKGMPSETSVRSTFRRLSKSLRRLGKYLMRSRGSFP